MCLFDRTSFKLVGGDSLAKEINDMSWQPIVISGLHRKKEAVQEGLLIC